MPLNARVVAWMPPGAPSCACPSARLCSVLEEEIDPPSAAARVARDNSSPTSSRSSDLQNNLQTRRLI
jgi:hypothetical protein